MSVWRGSHWSTANRRIDWIIFSVSPIFSLSYTTEVCFQFSREISSDEDQISFFLPSQSSYTTSGICLNSRRHFHCNKVAFLRCSSITKNSKLFFRHNSATLSGTITPAVTCSVALNHVEGRKQSWPFLRYNRRIFINDWNHESFPLQKSSTKDCCPLDRELHCDWTVGVCWHQSLVSNRAVSAHKCRPLPLPLH